MDGSFEKVKQNLNQYHLIIGVLLLGFFVVVGTFSYWQWQTLTDQQTLVKFTLDGEPFSCSADGGGDITSEEVYIAPTVCSADSENVIKREITLNTEIETENTTVYMDMWLNIKTLGTGLSESDNFMYALTTGESDCTDGTLASGNFKGLTQGGKVNLLTSKIFTETSTDTVYLWIWLDAAETSTATMNQPFNLQLGGTCTDKAMVLPEQNLIPGTYTSYDGAHTINVASDDTITYDNTYTLTRKIANSDSVITGSLGTDNKSSTFYMINDTTLINSAAVSYTENSSTVNLNAFTVFKATTPSTTDSNGIFEVWSNNTKVNSYDDFQSAIDAANAGDTVKITQNYESSSGAYVNKNLTIDGGNHYIFRTSSSNSVIIIDENIDVTISNLIIDGGSYGFEANKSSPNIQATSTSIPIKTGSDKTDVKLNMSAIVSKGRLKINNSTIKNNYVNGDGAALKILLGTVELNSVSFDHNRATGTGGAIYLGSKMTGTEETYLVESAIFNSVSITNNYSTGGAGICILNVKETIIDDTTFKNNVVTGGKGAAVLVSRQASISDNLGFLPILNIDNSVFEENWVGNDGSAMEIQDAQLTVKNSKFLRNVGIHSSSSCGCISFYMESNLEKNHVIDNCIFEENLGSASVLGDHGSSKIKIDISNTNFIRNKATYNSFLIYSAELNIENCVFDNEHASRAILDLRPAVTEADFPDGYKPVVVNLKDVSFLNTQYNTTDILVRNYDGSANMLPMTLILSNDVKANIDLWYQNKLQINGNFTGNINVGYGNISDNVEISSSATLSNNINYHSDEHLITLLFYGLEEKDGYNWEARRYIYSSTKTFTEDEFFAEHMVSEEGYELVYYTDAAFTTPWDYTVSADMTVYGKWVEK